MRIEAPFIDRNKAQVVAEGLRLQVPYELTWSCYEGEKSPVDNVPPALTESWLLRKTEWRIRRKVCDRLAEIKYRYRLIDILSEL